MTPTEPRPAIARPTINMLLETAAPQRVEPSSKMRMLVRKTVFGGEEGVAAAEEELEAAAGQHVRGSVPADIRKRVEVVGYARDGGADDGAVEGGEEDGEVEGGEDGEEDAEGWEGGGGGGLVFESACSTSMSVVLVSCMVAMSGSVWVWIVSLFGVACSRVAAMLFSVSLVCDCGKECEGFDLKDSDGNESRGDNKRRMWTCSGAVLCTITVDRLVAFRPLDHSGPLVYSYSDSDDQVFKIPERPNSAVWTLASNHSAPLLNHCPKKHSIVPGSLTLKMNRRARTWSPCRGGDRLQQESRRVPTSATCNHIGKSYKFANASMRLSEKSANCKTGLVKVIFLSTLHPSLIF